MSRLQLASILTAGALIAYACGGRSIRTEESESDEGTSVGGSSIGRGGTTSGANGSGAFGGTAVTGGLGGTAVTGGVGGTSMPGGRGGTGGTGLPGGRGGSGGGGNTGGTAGVGGSVPCPPSKSGGAQYMCERQPACIAIAAPTNEHVERNERADPPDPGEGGAGGGPSTENDEIASAQLCSVPENSEGFLAVDYYMPENPPSVVGLGIYSGRPCGGYSVGYTEFEDYAMPPPGSWTTQCFKVYANQLNRYVSIATDGLSRRPMVRNARFVRSCECPRQLTLLTTCGLVTPPAACD